MNCPQKSVLFSRFSPNLSALSHVTSIVRHTLEGSAHVEGWSWTRTTQTLDKEALAAQYAPHISTSLLWERSVLFAEVRRFLYTISLLVWSRACSAEVSVHGVIACSGQHAYSHTAYLSPSRIRHIIFYFLISYIPLSLSVTLIIKHENSFLQLYLCNFTSIYHGVGE